MTWFQIIKESDFIFDNEKRKWDGYHVDGNAYANLASEHWKIMGQRFFLEEEEMLSRLFEILPHESAHEAVHSIESKKTMNKLMLLFRIMRLKQASSHNIDNILRHIRKQLSILADFFVTDELFAILSGSYDAHKSKIQIKAILVDDYLPKWVKWLENYMNDLSNDSKTKLEPSTINDLTNYFKASLTSAIQRIKPDDKHFYDRKVPTLGLKNLDEIKNRRNR